MDTRLKNRVLFLCSTCSLIAAAVGIVCIGAYVWNWIDANLMDTVKLLRKLF